MLDALNELSYIEQNIYHAGYSFFVQNIDIQCIKLHSISTTLIRIWQRFIERFH